MMLSIYGAFTSTLLAFHYVVCDLFNIVCFDYYTRCFHEHIGKSIDVSIHNFERSLQDAFKTFSSLMLCRQGPVD